ncbi:hypothetical protein [Chelativorans salis]|uniref:Uncharacterized protein n=1 Tax=Chelativorans salis TaxID=2978478 RepID=A0ABT2LJP0_9HYPH|nr:hypothetical protein [Chelativorans sp. EGI FJ00035]MCT7373903.1 hypothetical protein [Chelativorans sp. EGI FJ00035]
MPLQNRVDPFGAIHAVAARGLFTGNRGVIHDPATKTLLSRRWTTKAWIVCDCAFGDRRREVMGKNSRSGGASWTELFFLDEVTALAAGHRPCFYCRREQALDFARCFAGGEGRATAPEMDARLHRERRASGGAAVALELVQLPILPEGTMVESAGSAYALRGARLLPWTFTGYAAPRGMTGLSGPFTLITPPSTVSALANGYRPVWHESARS